MEHFTILIFWILTGLVMYTYLGYPVILFVLVKGKRILFPETKRSLPEALPEVTLLIPAHNESSLIEEKMQNCLALDYPSSLLKILWITDGSTDETPQMLVTYPGVTVLHQPERKGKTAAMNRAMQWVDTPLVIFTDANTLLNKEAIKEMVRCFSDPQTACVAGEKRIRMESTSDAASSGEGLYWKYESTLKKWDSQLAGAAGAAGELFGIRTKLFEPMPEDTLLDDFVLSLRLVIRGYRITYCPEAYAMEWASENVAEEEKRKVRIAAGGIQSVTRLSPLLNPFRFGLFSFQYISHRVLRWTLAPWALFILLPINAYILCIKPSLYIYQVAFTFQILFYALAMAGKISASKQIRNKFLFVPYYFLFMNWSVIKGLFYLFHRKDRSGAWVKARRKVQA